MTKAEIKTYPLGIFKIYWKSGGSSMAAIGQIENGDRWLAPVNWTHTTEDQHIWQRVERVVLKVKL